MATRDLKHIEIGSIKTKEGKKNPDHESRPRELSGSIKQSNICVTGVPEEEEIEKGKEGLFAEIIDENRHPNPGGTENSHQNPTEGQRQDTE